MKGDVSAVGIAFLLALAVSAAFLQPAWALSDWQLQWSSNETARSYVAGAYTQIGDPYSPQVHQGNITEGNVAYCAYTEFYEYDQNNSLIFDSDRIYLCNYTGSKETYTHSGIYHIRTWTNSYLDWSSASLVNLEIGPPGTE